MFFYCIYILILIIFFADYKIKGRQKSKLLSQLGIVFFIAVLIFRFDVGYDYAHYYQALYPTFNVTEVSKWEPVCQAICYIADFFSYPQLFFIISGAITSILLFKSFNKYTDTLLLAVLTYLALFFETSFGFVRQGLALAVILYGYKYLVNNNFIKYCLLCAIAGTIHYSAFVCLLFPFLYNFFSSFPRLIIVVLLLFVGYKFLFEIAEQISFYDNYINEDVQIKGGRFIRFSNIILLSTLYYFASHCKNNNQYKRIIMIGFIGSIFPFILGSHIGGRIAWYFMIYICVILPNIISQYKLQIRSVWVAGLVSMFLLTIYVSSGNKDKSPYTPYQTIFTVDLENPSFKI